MKDGTFPGVRVPRQKTDFKRVKLKTETDTQTVRTLSGNERKKTDL